MLTSNLICVWFTLTSNKFELQIEQFSFEYLSLIISRFLLVLL